MKTQTQAIEVTQLNRHYYYRPIAAFGGSRVQPCGIMNTIWKYALAQTDVQTLWMPEGATILCVQSQHGTLFLWASVNSESQEAHRVIEIHGTGNPMPNGSRSYIGTVQMMGAALVWHIFEQLP